MTQITAPIFSDAEAFLKDLLPDMYTDNIAAVYPDGKLTEDFGRSYFDEEEEESKFVTFEGHVEALKELVRLVSEKKLFVGGIKNPTDLAEDVNWDAEVVDAYFQLCYHGEVIYG